jgi:hypothetical protein
MEYGRRSLFPCAAMMTACPGRNVKGVPVMSILSSRERGVAAVTSASGAVTRDTAQISTYRCRQRKCGVG